VCTGQDFFSFINEHKRLCFVDFLYHRFVVVLFTAPNAAAGGKPSGTMNMIC